MNRRTAPDLDPSHWPVFDASALRNPQRAIYFARHQAIELYVANTSLTTIEARTGVKRGQLYRLLESCLAPHDDGRVFGWRALVPYARVAPYQRIAKVRLQSNGSGAAGAFDELMQRHPVIAEWLVRQVRSKRVTIEQRSSTDGLRVRFAA